MPPEFASPHSDAIVVHVIEQQDLETYLEAQPDRVAAWARSSGFSAALGTSVLVPAEDGGLHAILAGYGTASARERGRFHLASLAASLPEGTYRLEGLAEDAQSTESLGWLLASYGYSRYREQPGAKARLVAPDAVDAERLQIIAAGEFLTRDLINTPASDMGPADLEAAASDLAKQHGAKIDVIRGEALLDQNFPMIHTVGRAAEQAPRLIDIHWGSLGRKLTLVGKGVCFDTGGLNLKPGSSMGLMKKDLCGSATVLCLAHMIMAL